jgi:YVTN family beta-propeller protein
MAVNPVTNKTYVVNPGSNIVTVIDGAGDTFTATVAVGSSPIAATVNPVTNKIYVVKSPECRHTSRSLRRNRHGHFWHRSTNSLRNARSAMSRRMAKSLMNTSFKSVKTLERPIVVNRRLIYCLKV